MVCAFCQTSSIGDQGASRLSQLSAVPARRLLRHSYGLQLSGAVSPLKCFLKNKSYWSWWVFNHSNSKVTKLIYTSSLFDFPVVP